MQPIIPLEIAMMIDIPSMFFVGISTLIPSAITRGITRIHLVEGIRRIALPAGILGTLIGFMMMLINMSDPSAFAPAFRIAMLTSWYGVIVYAITSWILRNTNDYQLDGVVRPSVTGATILAAGSLFFLFSHLNLAFIDTTSMLFLILGLPLLTLQRNKYPLSYRIMRGGIASGLFGIIYGSVNLLNSMDDPAMIGPAMAIAIISSLYTNIIIIATATQIPVELSAKQMRWQYLFWGVNIGLLYTMAYVITSLF
ncbi:MAG: hypothetical protein CL916_13730 [Deltaproteobacteria bacterium]|nr:hypothetical protein [Deltaproteobacteria bacterium]